MMFRRRSLASLLLSAAAAVRVAHADPAATDLSTAKQAFESAVSLEGERHWAEAAVKLRQAIAVKDTPGLRFHLAHCELEQGHLVEASLEYDRAGELLRQGAKAPDVQKLLGPASEALKPRIPRVTVELPEDLSRPTASLDGKPYPPSELALGIALNPGRHSLYVSAPARRPFERTLVLKEGEQITVRAELAVAAPPTAPASAAKPAPAAPPSTPLPTRDHSSSSTKLYLMLSESVLTVAGLGVGIGAQLAAASASDRVSSAQARIDAAAPGNRAACKVPELSGTCNDLQSAISDHDSAVTLSEVGFITAGVGTVALVTTWLAYPNDPSSTSSVQLHPVAGLGHIGVIGTF
jgi:hypothetical protein